MARDFSMSLLSIPLIKHGYDDDYGDNYSPLSAAQHNANLSNKYSQPIVDDTI